MAADWLAGVYAVQAHCGHSLTLVVENAFDANIATSWTHSVDETHFVEIDLGAVYLLSQFRRYKISGGQYNWTDALLYLSNDGVTWGAAVLTFTTSTTSNAYSEHAFTEQAARYVRLEVAVTGISNFIAAAEIELYGELAGGGGALGVGMLGSSLFGGKVVQ